MIERLRDRIRDVFSRLRRPRRRQPVSCVKGCVQNVIVVKPPDRRFREAVFILRDDYLLSPEADRRQLLQDAKDAAWDYTASLLPGRRRRAPLWALIPLALALASVVLKLVGII